ncbi:MAG: tetratricopeptide repeat protein [Methylophilaceae bacterium]
MKLQNTLTILTIGLFLISFNSLAKEPSKAIVACNDAVNKGDGAAALQLSEAILKKNASDHEGLLCKGRALGLQNKYTEAITSFEQAIKSTEDSFAQVVSYILMGNLHKTNNKTGEAIVSYNNSLKICAKTNNQTYSRINHNLIGDAHTQAKDLNAALDSYLVGVRLANNDNERAESFEKTAVTYNTLGQYDKAVEFQLKAVLMQQKAGTLTAYADASLALGQYYYNAENYSNAERVYKKLAKFGKDNGGAYYEAKANFRLAEALAANGDKEAAKPLLSNALNQANKIGAKQLASEIDASQKKLNI